jgi:hypothetical protein
MVKSCGFNLDWEATDIPDIYLFPKKNKLIYVGSIPASKPKPTPAVEVESREKIETLSLISVAKSSNKKVYSLFTEVFPFYILCCK